MILSDFDILLPQPVPGPGMVTRWGAVTGVAPLRVRLDGDTDPLAITPDSLIPALTVGDRVLCLRTGRQLVILGPHRRPAGIIEPYAGDGAPEGSLPLVGQNNLSRTQYGRLFSVVGTRYGNGDGSTTFGLPDARGRVLVAADPTRIQFATIGQTGGTVEETLTIAQTPPHRHALKGYGYQLGNGNTGWRFGGAGEIESSDVVTDTGGGQPHNNLQPYLTVGNWCITY